jgi:Zn-dependent protease with chaperone function
LQHGKESPVATDFFERQSQAYRSTKLLVALFVLGVAGIAGVAFLAVLAATGAAEADGSLTLAARGDAFLAACLAGGGALALIGGGSLFKVAQLRGGGSVVAEQLGGRRVYPDSADVVERRLLNVVEEMAIASGVPTPPVFLLDDEQGINAFAAGYAPSDAVVAVTRGCAEQLSREELQGVVAHEFSHILNGDMRLNIRLIGILHGILLLGLLGRLLMRLFGQSRGSRDEKGGLAALALAGAALFVLGYLGTFVGNLIKAAVSRQREFLADASAAQFTRNPSGLAAALKRIGSLAAGSRLQAVHAAEASHLFFAAGLREAFFGLTSTHPPLAERIRRLDPHWDGVFPPPRTREAAWSATTRSREVEGVAGLAPAEALDVSVVARASAQVGDPTLAHRQYAAALLAALPPEVAAAAREPYGARAVLFALLADRQPAARLEQRKALSAVAAADVVELAWKLLPLVDATDVRARLPLVDLALPALRAMSRPQYENFTRCFQAMAESDRRLGLFEWMLHAVLLRHLRPQFDRTAPPRPPSRSLRACRRECSVLLSALALADARSPQAAEAIARAAERLPELELELLAPADCNLRRLHQALDALACVKAKQRQRLIDACAACICADGRVTVAEAELLRGVCDMLDCPLPPLLPGQPLPADAAEDRA